MVREIGKARAPRILERDDRRKAPGITPGSAGAGGVGGLRPSERVPGDVVEQVHRILAR